MSTEFEVKSLLAKQIGQYLKTVITPIICDQNTVGYIPIGRKNCKHLSMDKIHVNFLKCHTYMS